MSSSHILYCRICIISSFQVFKDVQANSSRFVLVKRDSAAARGVKTRAGSLCRNPPAARLFIFRLVTKPLWGRHKLKQRERLHYIHIIGLSVFPRHTGGGPVWFHARFSPQDSVMDLFMWWATLPVTNDGRRRSDVPPQCGLIALLRRHSERVKCGPTLARLTFDGAFHRVPDKCYRDEQCNDFFRGAGR